MSEPAWAQPGRQYVPSHVQPGSTRSSFAKPDSYNLPQHASSPSGGASAGGNPGQASSSPVTHRSGFATRQKSRTKRTGSAEVMAEDELPPTLSIRSAPNPSLDIDADLSLNFLASGPNTTSSANSKLSSPRGVPVLVFGFPPGSAAEVLQFFGKMGEIIENSPTNDTSTENGNTTGIDRVNSVECGRNWLRITFRDRNSAQAALAHNGHIMPGQYVIGCVLADHGEPSTGVTQSSTNSLLLDDSELSLVHEQSLASIDVTGDKADRLGEKPGEKPGDKSDDASMSLGKIVPLELSNQLFREQSPVKRTALRASELTTTPTSQAPSGNQSLAGRVFTKITDLVFGWDV